MFDIGFSEILVIAVVALVVIGPERLPKVARTLGLLTGRMQRYVSTVKADIDRELHLDELRKLEGEARHTIASVESQVAAESGDVERTIKSTVDDVAKSP
ncbi:MAG TPA: Sec-independent protein translocase protein TatB [Methylophilaceae bacterium]|nr:Sec-independent protein translocase protein TatB [Methylophilaceae bacterium]